MTTWTATIRLAHGASDSEPGEPEIPPPHRPEPNIPITHPLPDAPITPLLPETPGEPPETAPPPSTQPGAD